MRQNTVIQSNDDIAPKRHIARDCIYCTQVVWGGDYQSLFLCSCIFCLTATIGISNERGVRSLLTSWCHSTPLEVLYSLCLNGSELSKGDLHTVRQMALMLWLICVSLQIRLTWRWEETGTRGKPMHGHGQKFSQMLINFIWEKSMNKRTE